MTENYAHTLLAISMAMSMRWYGAKRIAHYCRSRATLDAGWTPPPGEYSSRIAPADAMVIDFDVQNRVVVL